MLNIFGRRRNDGNIDVLHTEDGEAVTILDSSVYPVGSEFGARYHHPQGIVLTPEDAASIGLEIEDDGR